MRKSGNRVRINGQLIDTATGAHIWAGRVDGSLEDVFELQDRVASTAVGAIEPKLRMSEMVRAARKPTEHLDAYDLDLRGMAEAKKSNLDRWDASLPLLHQALAIDPSYAPAAALVGAIRLNQRVAGVELADQEIAEALRLARHAIETGRDDPDALARCGGTLAFFAGEHAVAMSAIERATILNPNCTLAWAYSSSVNCFANRPDAAIAAAQQALRLSPLDPDGFAFKWSLAFGLMLPGRYEEAMEWVDRSLHDRPSHRPAIRGKVALCGYLERADEAREWVRRLLEAVPTTTISGYKAFGATFQVPGTLAV